MNSNLRKLLSLALAIVMVAGILAGCGSKEPAATEAPAATEGAAAEAPASTGADTIVYADDYLSEKFSPFFADTTYDKNAVALTQVELLPSDREGNVVLNGIEGQVIPYNGTDYTYYSLANCEIVENADGTVTYKLTLGCSIYTYVDNHDSVLDHIGSKKFGLADSYDEYVCPFRYVGKVLRSGMANSNRAVLLKQKQCHRLADYVTATDNHALLAGWIYLVKFKQLHNARRRTREKIVLSKHYFADVFGVEGVNVLVGIDTVDNLVFANMLGQRELNENAVNVRVGVKLIDLFEERILTRIGGHLDLIRVYAYFEATLVLISHVYGGCGIISDQHYRKAGSVTKIGLEFLNSDGYCLSCAR